MSGGIENWSKFFIGTTFACRPTQIEKGSKTKNWIQLNFATSTFFILLKINNINPRINIISPEYLEIPIFAMRGCISIAIAEVMLKPIIIFSDKLEFRKFK